jgi:hypothetical protein
MQLTIHLEGIKATIRENPLPLLEMLLREEK